MRINFCKILLHGGTEFYEIFIAIQTLTYCGQTITRQYHYRLFQMLSNDFISINFVLVLHVSG